MRLIFFNLNNEMTQWKIRYPFTDTFDYYYTAYY